MKLKLYTLVLSGILFNHSAIGGRVPILDDVSERNTTIDSLDIETESPIMFWMPLPESAPPIFHAINQGNVSEVRAIMEQSSDIEQLTSAIGINMPGGFPQQFTPLDLARVLERAEIIDILRNF